MLGKLIKHEFRATGRIMLPILIALPVLTVLSAFAMRQMQYADADITQALEIIFILAFGAFIIAVIAAGVMTLWMMINRFHKNLMGDEGYLMHTLPASVHEHIWSKLIVSVAWFAGMLLVIGLLVTSFVFIISMSNFSQFIEGFPSLGEIIEVIRKVFGYKNGRIVLFILEFLVMAILGTMALCLHFYAAISIGHSFANHKLLFSVLAFFVLNFAASFLQASISAATGVSMYTKGIVEFMNYVMHYSLIYLALQCAILYSVTALMLKKRLNLA